MSNLANEVYERLSEPFDVTFSDVRGGVSLTYITGEQIVSRLNEVLGVDGWTFKVIEHGVNPEADEAWTLAELVVQIGTATIVKQQFGSQKLKRSRSSGAPLDLGFDLKGATTDAMKKCASLLGVGLYLSKKKGGVQSKALSRWKSTRQRAKKVGIEVTWMIPGDATDEQIESWTDALVSRIEEAKKLQPTKPETAVA